MATPNDQGRNDQENPSRGVEVENNIVAVESTRHRRRCLVLIVIVVLCFIVIGGGVSVPFVLPLINQSGVNKSMQLGATPTSTIDPPTTPTENLSYSWGEWSPWSPCSNTTCAVILSTRQRICTLIKRAAHDHVLRNGSDCVGIYQETLRCPFVFLCIDCKDAQALGESSNGTYFIDPDGKGPFLVYCDMTTDGGGWTVFQRRQDGSVDFNRTWDEYKKGFGNLLGEFWLGNEYIYRLTSKRNRTLRADFTKPGYYYHYYSVYNNFSISSENYALYVGSHREGHSDSLTRGYGQQFSTADRDNDRNSYRNTAAYIGGGWWYSDSSLINKSPNGLYRSNFGWYSIFDRLAYFDFKIK